MSNMGGKFAFKSIHKTGSMFEFCILLDKEDYVAPCFDEDIDNKWGMSSGNQFSTISPSENSVHIQNLPMKSVLINDANQ